MVTDTAVGAAAPVAQAQPTASRSSACASTSSARAACASGATSTQLHTVVAEHGWRLNATPATYEQMHLSLLAGLLGNIGCKSDDEDWYLGARGIKFWRHPGAHLSKKPGRWLVAAELVETTRLYGRGWPRSSRSGCRAWPATC
jgi:hypothetical protein